MKKKAYIFKALSDEIRVRIMKVLLEAKEALCVCEIVDALNEPQYCISRHMQELKRAGLVSTKREGTWILYSIKRGDSKFKEKILEAIDNIPREKNKDIIRLKKRLQMRVNGKCVIGYRKEKKK